MINNTLENYIKTYRNFFDYNFCCDVVDSLSTANWRTHSYSNSKTNEIKSFSNELSVSLDNIPLRHQLDSKLRNVINQYINIDNKNTWYVQWNGHTPVRFNKYEENSLMRLHCDHIHTMFDGRRKGIPVLTIIGMLNNQYTGGEFVLCHKEFKLHTGDIIIFPSNFLYPHEVKPIKTGTRYSFVSWVW